MEFPEIPEARIAVLGELPDDITESSGQVRTPYGTLLGHNDSESGPVLYEYTSSGVLIRKITVANAKNVDWEDIALEGDSLFISDTGNNSGWRKWLTIYAIRLPDRSTIDTSVTADRIQFKYPSRGFYIPHTRHNFDCEALIVLGDRLCVFSKNHGDYRTTAYTIPRKPGRYTAEASITFQSYGLITGADMRGDTLVLLGYSKDNSGFGPFIWWFNDFDSDVDAMSGRRVNMPMRLQTEAISFDVSGNILFTNEEEDGDRGVIMSVEFSELIDHDK